MKFKIPPKVFGYLNEAPQTNNVRWTILKEVGENSFERQSNPLKCTDYFNDVVAFFHTKKKFSVYGFTNDVKFEEHGGLFIHANNLAPNFEHNVAVINEQLRKDLGGVIEICKDDTPNELILYFPKEVFVNTYAMSLLMWVLRLSNYGIAFENWDDIWKSYTSPARQTEGGQKSPTLRNYAASHGFKVGEKFNKYWFFSGNNYNSSVDSWTPMLVHDCGCNAWVAHMSAVS